MTAKRKAIKTEEQMIAKDVLRAEKRKELRLKKNPYREGSVYHSGYAFIKSKHCIVTKAELITYISKLIVKNRKVAKELRPQLAERYAVISEYHKKSAILKAATATATVLLSPRKEDGRGDSRGNISSMGHRYYLVLNKCKKDEEQKYHLYTRKVVLARRVREDHEAIVQEVIEKISPKRTRQTRQTRSKSISV